MGDQVTDPNPQDNPPTDQPPATERPDTGADADTGKLAADLDKWKALARKHEAAAKANADAAKRLTEIEDQGKSELEKLTARAEQAERERAEVTGRALRLEVAFEKGLTPQQAKRLVGASREELEADADEILRDFPALKPDGRPRGDAGLGPRPPAAPSDPKQADRLQIEADLAASRRR